MLRCMPRISSLALISADNNAVEITSRLQRAIGTDIVLTDSLDSKFLPVHAKIHRKVNHGRYI